MMDSPQRRLPERPLPYIFMWVASAHRLLTVCYTTNTFDTLPFVVTRGNEVSQWFLNVSVQARPTSGVLINSFGDGSRPRPHLKERQLVRSLMRFSTATSARWSRLEGCCRRGNHDSMNRFLPNAHPALGCRR